MMKRLLFVFTVLIISLNLICCKKIFIKRAEKTKTIVVLLDLSESTRNFRKSYFENFKKILSSINHGDALAVVKITESSVTEPETFVEDFPKFVPRDKMGNPTDNPLLVRKAKEEADKRLNERKEEILKRVESILFTQRKVLYTDILSSLHVAQSLFEKLNRDKNILVIFSDMVEETPEYNFKNLTRERIKYIIEKEKQRLPDLKNVVVYVVPISDLSREQFFIIQSFWLRYFKECGAILPKENYSIAFEFKE